jgi:hypothetical protein
MQVMFEDKEYELDVEGLSFTEARYIYRQTGLTVKGLLDGLTELNPDAAASLYWLMLKQNGQTMDINKLPDFPILKFAEAILSANEADEEGEPDPTLAEPAANQA